MMGKMELCLGTVQFGMDYGIFDTPKKHPDYCISCLDYATQNGIRAIDTATAYGMAEEIVGKFLAKRTVARDHLFISTKLKQFCLPLKVNIQDGLASAASWKEQEGIIDISPQSHVEQMIESAYEAAKVIGFSYLVLDRYFLTRPALRLLDRYNEADHKDTAVTLIEIITKAKTNCTAYRKPLPKKPGSKGRPRLKGKEIHLKDLFLEKQRFRKTTAFLYGRYEEISYYCINLLWGQGLYKELRFVLVECNGQRSILVSTDLTLKPVHIIELYGRRFSTEALFREMKQQVGAFSYHFWTSSMPKLNHYARRGEGDTLADIRDSRTRTLVLKTLKAVESFVFCASVATGITQMLSLDEKLSCGILKLRYLRTYSSKAPSEGSVMYYRKRLFWLLPRRPESFVTQYINEKQDPLDYEDKAS